MPSNPKATTCQTGIFTALACSQNFPLFQQKWISPFQPSKKTCYLGQVHPQTWQHIQRANITQSTLTTLRTDAGLLLMGQNQEQNLVKSRCGNFFLHCTAWPAHRPSSTRPYHRERLTKEKAGKKEKEKIDSTTHTKKNSSRMAFGSWLLLKVCRLVTKIKAII